MKTFEQVVKSFEAACNAHLAINTFNYGTIDKLDTSIQNVRYPYIFLRPITSTGFILDGNGRSGVRSLTFELYSLDVPKQTDSDYLGVMSDTEQYIYDILGWFNFRGTSQQEEWCTLANIAPVNEAFQDRTFGFVATLDYNESAILNYCNYPQ